MKAVATMIVVLLALAACSPRGAPQGLGSAPSSPQPTTLTGEPTPTGAGRSDSGAGPPRPRVLGTVATHLAAPWSIAFLPDGTALVSERDKADVVAIPRGGGAWRRVGRLQQAAPNGEAGLLGLAVSPTYARDSFVFAYVSTGSDNRVVRMRYDGRRLGAPQVILAGIPVGVIHDGGRLAFGPDGYLYVSTGETGDGRLAQDPKSLGGKILRITSDGRPAPGNPAKGSPVWSMGHRNVEGLAFDDHGRLWASELGQSTWDELNLIERAGNYGWPLAEGRGELRGYRDPLAQWRTSDASPSGLAYADGALWMASLAGRRMWRIPVNRDGSIGRPVDFLVGEYGRLRAVVLAPDGTLWVSTSNRDGRGAPGPQDDRILRVALR
jgi:glucose/arabinose dehydrogenase